MLGRFKQFFVIYSKESIPQYMASIAQVGLCNFILLNQACIDEKRNNNLCFDYLIKKIIWSQLSDLLLWIFNISIGKQRISNFFTEFFNYNNTNLTNPLICFICRQSFTMPFTLECTHNFCYYCIMKYNKLLYVIN